MVGSDESTKLLNLYVQLKVVRWKLAFCKLVVQQILKIFRYQLHQITPTSLFPASRIKKVLQLLPLFIVQGFFSRSILLHTMKVSRPSLAEMDRFVSFQILESKREEKKQKKNVATSVTRFGRIWPLGQSLGIFKGLPIQYLTKF